MEEDANAYDAVIAAMRLAKKTDVERGARVLAMQQAYERATTVPLDTMQACSDALGIALVAARKGNRNAISDAGVAALVAEAGLRAAGLNARINLAALKDNALRAEIEKRLETSPRGAGREGEDGIDPSHGRLLRNRLARAAHSRR